MWSPIVKQWDLQQVMQVKKRKIQAATEGQLNAITLNP
jgi:hypothetical protein